MKVLSVIGDIHGCCEEFVKLYDLLVREYGPPSESHTIVLVGDIIDRGPASAECFLFVQEKGIPSVMGNHEWMFVESFHSHEYREMWLANGGYSTLQSVHRVCRERGEEPDHFLRKMYDFFREMPLYLVYAGNGFSIRRILITHAGISPRWSSLEEALLCPLDFPESVIWYRGEPASLPETIQVFGHTPREWGPVRYRGGWNVDTGCVYEYPGLGVLSALSFNLEDLDEQPAVHRVSCQK